MNVKTKLVLIVLISIICFNGVAGKSDILKGIKEISDLGDCIRKQRNDWKVNVSNKQTKVKIPFNDSCTNPVDAGVNCELTIDEYTDNSYWLVTPYKICEKDNMFNLSGTIIDYQNAVCKFHNLTNEVHCDMTNGTVETVDGVCEDDENNCQIIRLNVKEGQTEVVIVKTVKENLRIQIE